MFILPGTRYNKRNKLGKGRLLIIKSQLHPHLEGRLRELYDNHKTRAANIDWSYHEFLPWDQGRDFHRVPWEPGQGNLPEGVLTAVETALLTEVNLPWFTTYLSSAFKGSLSVMTDFIHTWTAEEDQHSNLLETYLLLTRNGDPHRLHRLRKGVVEQGWTSEISEPIGVMAYTSIQELSTLVFYNNVAKAASPFDPQLAKLLRRLAKDESLHYAFYRDCVKVHLELDANYIFHIAPVIRQFTMPGADMPDFDERMKVIGRTANYGPQHFYDQVIRVLIDYWGIEQLRPSYAAAEEARIVVLKYRDKLKRIADRTARRIG